MKKIYSRPMTEQYVLTLSAQMLAGSSELEKPGSKLQQDISDAGSLEADDEGGDNLGKGGNIWNAWD